MHRSGLIAVAVSVLAVGCLSREVAVQRLHDDNPRVQAATIARVVREGDRSMAGDLIDLLESDDEGVRFMAAAGLHRLTGRQTNFHFAKEAERQRIIAEWRQWWEAEGGCPATDAATPETGPENEGAGGASQEAGKEPQG